MNYIGDFTTADTVYVLFHTFDSNDPSASVTITGLAVTDIEIYKDGSAIQRASDNGYTLLDTDGIDFDGVTGIHGFSIDLSDNSDAGFFAAGSDYHVVVSSITVDAATINFVAAHFSIENRSTKTPLSDIESSLVIVKSDLVVIESDSVVIESDTTAIHSDTTIIASDVVQVYSDTTIIVSDTTAIHSDTTIIHSDTIVISSDTAVIESDTVAIEDAVILASGTADSGTTTTLVDAARTEADTDYWAGDRVLFTSGTIDGQVREITAFTPGTDTITFSPATTQAVATQNYVIIQGVAASGLTAGQASDLTAIESELILVHSETTVIQSDTTVIESDTVVIESDTTKIESDTAVIESDTTAIHSDTTIIASDTVVISSDTAVIESDTTRIELALITATGALEGTPSSTVLQTDLAEATNDHYNNMVFVMTSGDEAGEARRISDYTGATGTVTLKTALSGAPTATETFAILNIPTYDDAIYSDTTIVVSDTTVIESDTTKIESDATVIESDTTAIHSDTTIIASDVVQVYSDTTIIVSDTTAIHSDTTIIHSDTIVISSDTAVIESDTTKIESDTAVIESDTTVIESDTTAIQGDLPSRATKNVALSNFMFPMIDSTDDISPKTALTVTGEVSKDGAAFAALSNAVAEVSDGWYKVNLTAAEMNADVVALRFTAAGANEQLFQIITQPT